MRASVRRTKRSAGRSRVVGDHLGVGHAEGPQQRLVVVDRAHRCGDLLGVPLAQRLEALGQCAPGREGRREPASRRLAGGAAVEDLGADLDPPRLVPAPVVQGDLCDRRGDPRGERPHRRSSVAARRLDLGGRRDRLADHHQRPRAEALPRFEDQPDRQDGHADRSPLELGLDRDARGAGPQRLQLRLVVADAFRKDRDRRPGGELLAAAGEGLEVTRRVRAGVDAPKDRKDPGEIEQLGEQRNAPERVLAEQARRQAQRPEHEERIDQPVDVVRDDDRGTGRDPVLADDLDAPKEDRQRQTAGAADQRVNPAAPHPRRPARRRWRRPATRRPPRCPRARRSGTSPRSRRRRRPR